METRDKDQAPMQDRQAQLATKFMEEFLRGRNTSLETVHQLPEKEAKRLMIQASVYASTKLAELENRANIVQQIHGTSQM